MEWKSQDATTLCLRTPCIHHIMSGKETRSCNATARDLERNND
jgi:hypothetical protein